MQVHAIPVAGKVLLYRPLRRLAFVGNQTMADLTLDLVRRQAEAGPSAEPKTVSEAHQEAARFLQEIGFLAPDPPAPEPPPRDPFKPTTAVLLLTSRCNLRCIYCYAAGGERETRDLTFDVARVVIDEAHRNAVELGRPRFDLSLHGGGEPVLAWDVVQKATAYARSKDLPCEIGMVSNGVWTPEQRDWIIDNLDGLSISFDGGPDTQDRQRPFAGGRGTFHSVMETIHALDQVEFRYGIRMTATAPWRDRLAEDVRFICEETGVPAMQVEPAFYDSRGEPRGPTEQEAESFVEAFVEAFDIASQAGRNLSFSGARPWALSRAFCSSPYSSLIANPTGSLVACFEVTDNLHSLIELSRIGSINEQGFKVDMQSRAKMHDYLAKRQEACDGCFCFWHCAGDCYVRGTLASNGGPPGDNPRCEMNRQITAHILMWYVMNGDGLWRGQGSHPQELQLMKGF